MTTPVSRAIDDRDLDDAALWAVIDSAEASHSSSRPRKHHLSIKYPTSAASVFPKTPQVPKHHSNNYVQSSDLCTRPQKVARSCASVISDGTSPLALVRTPANSKVGCFSPEAYLSPQIGNFSFKEVNGSEVLSGSYVCGDGGDVQRHCLSGNFPSVSLFKEYQNAALAILEKSDYTMISGCPFIKKSGWRKMSLYFNLSFEIKDRFIEFDENRNVQRADFLVRAYMQGGRFCDGWGSCERQEKKFIKPNRDVPSTAETRAKNKACQDLLGIGVCRASAS